MVIRPLRCRGLPDSARPPTALHLTSFSDTGVYSAMERAISSAVRERARLSRWPGSVEIWSAELRQFYIQNGSILFPDDCRKCFTLPLQGSRDPADPRMTLSAQNIGSLVHDRSIDHTASLVPNAMPSWPQVFATRIGAWLDGPHTGDGG